jgi:uncharacterized protein YndB with AHSA1/START domain
MIHSTQVLSESDVFLTRVLDAPRDLVWAAFTQAEHLAQWWGPAGCSTRVLTLDFRPGGLFHYAMATPAGESFGRFVYREITAPERLSFILSFADAQANIVRAPFSTAWPLEMLSETRFSEEGDGGRETRLTMAAAPFNAADEERAAFEAGRDGLAQGTNASLDQLSKYLRSIRS